jgi:hypothetical protein
LPGSTQEVGPGSPNGVGGLIWPFSFLGHPDTFLPSPALERMTT